MTNQILLSIVMEIFYQQLVDRLRSDQPKAA